MLNKQNTKGFSLIELLVVIAIIGILLMIGIPSYNQYMLKAKIVDIFVLADAHKIKLLEKIMHNSTTNSQDDHYVLDNPSKLVTKIEHLINHQDKQYVLRITANIANLGINPIKNQPLIIEFIAHQEDLGDLITWNCQYTKGYAEIIPKSCKEMVLN